MIYFSDFNTGSAAVVYRTEELLTETTPTLSSTYVDVLEHILLASEQQASTDYLIIWSVELQGTVASTLNGALFVNGASVHDQDPQISNQEISGPVDYHMFGGFHRYQSGGSPATATFKIRMKRSTIGGAMRHRNARITILKLGADDEYAESITRQTLTDTTANKTLTTMASLTFTPPSSGDYYIFASANLDLAVAISTSINYEISDGTTSTGEQRYRPRNANERLPCSALLKLTGISGSKTITFKIRQGSTGTAVVGVSDIKIFAIRADRFANAYAAKLAANNDTTSTSYVTAQNQTFTPAAGDHLTLAFWTPAHTPSNISQQSRYLDDATVVGEVIDEPFAAAADGVVPGFAHQLTSYANSSRTQAIQHLTEDAARTSRIQAGAAIVTLDLNGIT